MRLVVSLLNYRPGKIGGTETYLRRLLPLLAEVRPAEEVVLLCDRESAGRIGGPHLREKILDRSQPSITRARILEAFTPYRALWAERAIAELEPDVVFFPQQSIFPKRTAGRTVLTIHDLQHEVFPQNFSLADRLFRRAIYPTSARRAQRIIAISEFTRKAAIASYGLDSERIVTVPHGFDPPPLLAPAKPADWPERYWLYPAASFPHKGHGQLVQTLAALRRSGEWDQDLVLCGQKTSYWPRIAAAIEREGMTDRVRHLGLLDASQIAAAYAHCEGVFFPSTFEGFGLPILEAVAWKKRIVASRLEVFAELGLPAECQVDFSDPASVLLGIRQSAPLPLTRPAADWRECAERTWAVLEAAASDS